MTWINKSPAHVIIACDVGKGRLYLGSRSETKFSRTSGFDKSIESFGISNSETILSHMKRFQNAWYSSIDDSDLPSRYCFEHYKNIPDPYRLCQIRLGPNNNYRAVIMFPNASDSAYWIYAFKKEGRREPQEMDLARNRAKHFWDSIKRR